MAAKKTAGTEDGTTLKLSRLGSWGTAFVLALLPFHAVFTTWLGSNTGHIDAWRIWKELIIFGLAALALIILIRQKAVKRWLAHDRLFLLIFLYIALHLVTAVWALTSNKVNGPAVIYGLLANLRFVGFFLVVLVFATYSGWLRGRWPKLIFIPALIVISFGLLQLFLPADFLRHFGYGPDTIPATHLVDQKSEYQRLQSTLRGPNPLGAYLVLVLTLAAAGYGRLRKSRLNLSLLIAGGLIVLFFSYSRSALLGLAVSWAVLAWLLVTSAKWRRYIAVGVVGLVLVGGLVIWASRNNDAVQNTVFHTDETSQSAESSNKVRGQALRDGFEDLRKQPLGAGPGTAGPASMRNSQPPRIAENYFLQIGQEVGIVGLALFVAINILVAVRLYAQRQSTLAIGLLASLAGLTVINLVSHAWADDTLGLLWWGLAGIVLAQPVILNKKRKQFNVRTQKETTT